MRPCGEALLASVLSKKRLAHRSAYTGGQEDSGELNLQTPGSKIPATEAQEKKCVYYQVYDILLQQRRGYSLCKKQVTITKGFF